MTTERPLTKNITPDRHPVGVEVYEQAGGYEGLRAALRMSPLEVQEAVTHSNLRGRGGAGFPTGKKWSFVPANVPGPKYFVVNADEMEPGTMKDRLLMEGAPHQLVEGTIIGAYAIGATSAYIFLRWAYKKSARALEQAIAEASRRGYLGENILGSGYSLDLRLHTSAGRYMCGEETGLINAMEGRRATPRAKPPFPPVSGLWGRPTMVNNVETVCCIPHILRHGWRWFRDLSRSDDSGTKIYGVSGHVEQPGLWELPMGTPMGEILNNWAGGMADGRRFRGLLPGGASTPFMTDRHLDVKMDFTAPEKVGSRLGTGTMIVLDDRTCPVGMVLSLERFFARESCGWCTPCREGLPWIVSMLEALERGEGTEEDLKILEEQSRLLVPGNTFCALAPGAADPLRTAIEYFREDFVSHIRQRRCPWRPQA